MNKFSHTQQMRHYSSKIAANLGELEKRVKIPILHNRETRKLRCIGTSKQLTNWTHQLMSSLYYTTKTPLKHMLRTLRLTHQHRNGFSSLLLGNEVVENVHHWLIDFFRTFGQECMDKTRGLIMLSPLIWEMQLLVIRHVYTDTGVLSAGTSDGVCSMKPNILFNAPI